MAETRWNSAHGWLIAGMLINLVGVISGYVGHRIGEPAWLTAARFVCVIASFACLFMFFIRWRRYRAAERAGVEHTGD